MRIEIEFIWVRRKGWHTGVYTHWSMRKWWHTGVYTHWSMDQLNVRQSIERRLLTGEEGVILAKMVEYLKTTMGKSLRES